MIANIVIIAIVVVAAALAMGRYIIHSGHGDCCGDIDGVVQVKGPKDRDESHYDHAYDIEVAGMSCDNCASKVANAFNAEDGLFAEVSLKDGVAHVLAKQAESDDDLKRIVRNAGYGAGKVVTVK